MAAHDPAAGFKRFNVKVQIDKSAADGGRPPRLLLYAKAQLETHWLWRFSHSPRLRPSASHRLDHGFAVFRAIEFNFFVFFFHDAPPLF